MSTAVTLQPQLDAIAEGSGPWIASKLSQQELQYFGSQFGPDRNNPYPVPAVGSQAPPFSLQDSNAKTVTLQQLVDSGRHTVLIWYRGAWCPFCTATMKAYNARLADFAAVNTQIVAITPTLPEHTAKSVAEWELKFAHVLSDIGNVVARQYGTLNQLNEDMRTIQTKLGTDFKSVYGDKDSHLPHPGTFVVQAKTGKLIFSRVEMDFRKRVEPSELLSLLGKQ